MARARLVNTLGGAVDAVVVTTSIVHDTRCLSHLPSVSLAFGTAHRLGIRCAGGAGMKTPLSRATEPTYALFRIVVGVLFTFHGAQKLFGAFGGQAQPLMTRLGAAGVIELVCGLLVAIGLLTWIAALIASGEMVAAYYIAHMSRALWPIQNGGELAVLYRVSFLFIAVRGPGLFSVDR